MADHSSPLPYPSPIDRLIAASIKVHLVDWSDAQQYFHIHQPPDVRGTTGYRTVAAFATAAEASAFTRECWLAFIEICANPETGTSNPGRALQMSFDAAGVPFFHEKTLRPGQRIEINPLTPALHIR